MEKNLQHCRFPVLKRKDFTMKAVTDWEKVPKDAVESSSLEKFKT